MWKSIIIPRYWDLLDKRSKNTRDTFKILFVLHNWCIIKSDTRTGQYNSQIDCWRHTSMGIDLLCSYLLSERIILAKHISFRKLNYKEWVLRNEDSHWLLRLSFSADERVRLVIWSGTADDPTSNINKDVSNERSWSMKTRTAWIPWTRVCG